MSQLLDLLRVATTPSPTARPTVTLRDVLQLTALGYSLATAATAEPFSVVDEQVCKVRHPQQSRDLSIIFSGCICNQTLIPSLRSGQSHV